MGVRLVSKDGTDYDINNMAWSYILNLGELYKWKPEGTKKPKNFGLFKTWKGNYDSSEGQVVKKEDSFNLANALKLAIADAEFNTKSNNLIKQIQDAIEQSIGQKLGYDILTDVKIDFIKALICFLEHGEFSIN